LRFLKVLLFSLIIIIFGSGCILKKTDTTTTAPSTTGITDQDGKKVLEKAKDNLSKAKTAATAWKPDATFVAYNFKVPDDMNPKSLVETFAFGSAQEPDYWWAYSIAAEGNPVRIIVPKTDYLGQDLQPIQEQYWKISYVETLKTAEDNVGIEFRSQHPEADITLTLSQTLPKNWLWYTIEYRGAGNATKLIRINANDGKIYDDQGTLQGSTTPSVK